MPRSRTPLTITLLVVSLAACYPTQPVVGNEPAPGPSQVLRHEVPSDWALLRTGSMSADQNLTLPFGPFSESGRLTIVCSRPGNGMVEVRIDTDHGGQLQHTARCDGMTYIARLDGRGSVTLRAESAVDATWNLFLAPDAPGAPDQT